MKTHPFAGTPQHEQVYGNAFGPPIGYPGNGLGLVGGWFDPVDGDIPLHLRRPSDRGYSPDEEDVDDDEYTATRQRFAWVVYEVCESLTDRQRFVFDLRIGLKDGVQYTQEQVASFMGVSHQAVAEHEAAIKKKAEKVLAKVGLGWEGLFP